jgi:hypothetical protein
MLDMKEVINYSSFVDLNLEDSDYTEIEKTTVSPCSKGTMFRLSNRLSSQIFRLIDLPHSVLTSWALFISAVCKYGSGKQPNDTNRSATRTRTGGNGGRILEPVREYVRLLSQSFEPIAQDMCKSEIAINEGWLQLGTFLGKRTCD